MDGAQGSAVSPVVQMQSPGQPNAVQGSIPLSILGPRGTERPMGRTHCPPGVVLPVPPDGAVTGHQGCSLLLADVTLWDPHGLVLLQPEGVSNALLLRGSL
eukprot:14081613-Heterocapsa_arctica.AAC.1